MEALSDSGFVFDFSCYEEITCKEIDEESTFEAFICSKELLDIVNSKELFDYACSKYLDYTQAQYGGWDAKIVFENRRKKLIKGYYIFYPNLHQKWRISLWTHKFDETGLILYRNRNGDAYTTFHDISLKEEMLKSMGDSIDEAKRCGGIITEMKNL